MFNFNSRFVLRSNGNDGDSMTITAPDGPNSPNGNAGSSGTAKGVSPGNLPTIKGPYGSAGSTMTDDEIEQIYRVLRQHENSYMHMYADTDGNVTIGIGTMLSSIENAQKIGLLTSDNKPASPQQVADAFNAVKNFYAEHKNYAAPAYSSVTSLHITDDIAKSLLTSHVRSDRDGLRSLYSNLNNKPWAAVLATHDMIYNLGVGNLGNYTKFNDAFNKKEWGIAARESAINNPINKDRNDYLHDTFSALQRNAENSKSRPGDNH